jgi:uncharacterized protein (DUF433 family)
MYLESVERIESRPDICGGAACVSGTRIPVWLLESYRRLGLSDEQLLEAYPTLTEQDIQAARKHAAEHRAEMEREIEENEEKSDEPNQN